MEIRQRRKCALCHRIFDKYIPLDSYYKHEASKHGYKRGKPETMNRREYSCPYCYGTDRDRLCALFFDKLLQSKRGGVFRNVRLLHIAPSDPIQNFLFRELGEITCDTADLFMEGVDFQIDIQNMSMIENEKYDLFICFHVLEHVRDDISALKELHRILKPNGLGLILVPLDLKQKVIDEEYGLTEAENWKRFGQGDHVRKYSKAGFIKRMESAGFFVNQLGIDFFGKKVFKENAINKAAILYVVEKSKQMNAMQTTNICKTFMNTHDFFDLDIVQYKGIYQNHKKHFNFYIDKIELDSTHLYIWGWFYFENIDSRHTKLKLLMLNHNSVSIKGIRIRKREDIEDTFNRDGNGNYIFSGIEVNMNEDLTQWQNSDLYLLAENEENFGMIKIL